MTAIIIYSATVGEPGHSGGDCGAGQSRGITAKDLP